MRLDRLAAVLLSETCLSTPGSRGALAALVTAGALFLALPVYAATINVGTAQQLSDAISSAQNGDVIKLTGNITLDRPLPLVQRDVAFDGGNFTLSGNNQYRGLYVESGTVVINDLTIANAKAQGGNGGDGRSGRFAGGGSNGHGAGGAGGGGGAGLGGALFVASGANVTVSNVNLQGNSARGGNGGGIGHFGIATVGNPTSGGGGGLFGDGGTAGPNSHGLGGAGGGGAGEGGPGGRAGFGGGGGGSASYSVAGSVDANGGFGGGGGGGGRTVGGFWASPGRGGFGGGAGSARTEGTGGLYGVSGSSGGGGAGMGGAIFVQEGGTLNLAGSFNISGGSVAGGSGGQNGQAFGSGIFLQGNGSFSVTPGVGQTQTISDAIADQTGVAGSGGSWSLVKNGTGTTILTGDNAYSGGTTVNAGVLQGNASSLHGNITNNASVVFDQTGDGVYAGVMSGTGTLTKSGAGKLSINGIQTYIGATSVDAGNLNVNGSLASSSVVNVNAGGTLSGNGTFGNVHVNGGTISPSNSIGTLHINGNLNMGPNSEYYVEINGAQSDLIQVSGTANILSSTFRIGHDTDTTSAPVLPGKTYTILTTGGGLTGSTPSVGIADFPFLNFALSNDGFNAHLTTSRGAGAFAELATTRNEKTVANVLDTAGAANPLWQQVVGASEAQARAAFTSLGSASFHANVTGALSAQSQHLRDAVTDRLRQDFAYGTSLAPASNALGYAPDARNAYAADRNAPFTKAPPVAALTPAQVYAVWAQALGSWGSHKGDGNAANTDHSLGGVISGLDVTFNGQWRVGLAGGYSQSVFKSPDVAASGSSHNYHVALYGGGQLGAWGLRGGTSFSSSDITTSRRAGAVGLRGPQNGDYSANTTQVFGEVGYNTKFGVVALEPFANIAYVRVDGGINETGVVAVTGSSKLDTTYTTLGLRGATALTSTLTARGMLGWRHALGDVTPVAALAFQSGGAAFTLAGSPIARNALVAEAGVDVAIAANATLGVSWTGQYADQSHDNAVKGNFRWSF